MNHVNVLIVVQLLRHRIHVGVKMEVDLIYVINVEFTHRVLIKCLLIQICIHQLPILMIEVFEKVYVGHNKN